MRLVVSILILFVLFGCGRKYPIPPEYDYSLPPEESYVLVATWTGDGEYDLTNTVDVIVGTDGFIYVLTSNDVKKLYENGNLYEIIIEGLSSASAIHQDRSRNIYIADENFVRMFSRDGDLISSFEDTTIVSLAGITSDGDLIFISDSERNLVLTYDTSGNLIDTVASSGAGILNVDRPLGLCVWRDRIFIVSSDHNWVEALSLSKPRVNLLHLGGETHNGDTLEGYFITPVDVAIDDSGCVYVAEDGNRRIQKFDRYGDFIIETELSEAPVSVAVSRDGRSLFVGFTDRVEKYKRPETPGAPE